MSRQIQTPRPGRELEQEFGIKGGLVLRLDETVVPVSVLTPRRRRYAAGTVTVSGAVGFPSQVVLVNTLPFAGSGIQDTTVEVHQIIVRTNIATRVSVGHPSGAVAGFTNSTDKAWLAFAEGVSPTAAVQGDNTQAAIAMAAMVVLAVPANETTVIWTPPAPIILDGTVSNNQTLLVTSAAASTGLIVSFVWSEPPTEL